MLAKLATPTIRQVALKARRRRRRGQGMTEYIIIVGLIAILLITAVTAFRNALNNTFNAATKKVNSEITAPING
jgi:Flp pilus assembly pilin Flp